MQATPLQSDNEEVNAQAPRADDIAAHAADHPLPHCLVVMYHYVHDRDPLARPGSAGPYSGVHSVSVEAFRSQLDQLTTTLEPIDWPRYYAWTAGRASLPDRSFLLTFDDGLSDHAETVLPILEDRGLRGVFFVPTCILTSQAMLPAHQIHLLLSILDGPELERELRRILTGRGEAQWCDHLDAPASIAAPAEKMYHYENPTLARLKYWLTMELPLDLRDAVLDELFELHVGSSARWSRHWYLTWDDLSRMQTLGHTIGGHGHGHLAYTRLAPEEVRVDIRRAGHVLREGLGPELRPFSYPYGSFCNSAVAACKDAGFVHAFTTQPRWVDAGCDPHRLPRIDTINVALALREQLPCR